jgi:hypothetical protein
MQSDGTRRPVLDLPVVGQATLQPLQSMPAFLHAIQGLCWKAFLRYPGSNPTAQTILKDHNQSSQMLCLCPSLWATHQKEIRRGARSSECAHQTWRAGRTRSCAGSHARSTSAAANPGHPTWPRPACIQTHQHQRSIHSFPQFKGSCDINTLLCSSTVLGCKVPLTSGERPHACFSCQELPSIPLRPSDFIHTPQCPCLRGVSVTDQAQEAVLHNAPCLKGNAGQKSQV